MGFVGPMLPKDKTQRDAIIEGHLAHTETFLNGMPNVLQIENEFYGTIRPKRVIRPGERPLHALLERGVEVHRRRQRAAQRDRDGDDRAVGMPNPLVEWGRYITTFARGEVHVIAARPAMGKSALARKIAEQTGVAEGRSYFLNIKGPELLNMPRGASVIPLNRAGGGPTVVELRPAAGADGLSRSANAAGHHHGRPAWREAPVEIVGRGAAAHVAADDKDAASNARRGVPPPRRRRLRLNTPGGGACFRPARGVGVARGEFARLNLPNP